MHFECFVASLSKMNFKYSDKWYMYMSNLISKGMLVKLGSINFCNGLVTKVQLFTVFETIIVCNQM